MAGPGMGPMPMMGSMPPPTMGSMPPPSFGSMAGGMGAIPPPMMQSGMPPMMPGMPPPMMQSGMPPMMPGMPPPMQTFGMPPPMMQTGMPPMMPGMPPPGMAPPQVVYEQSALEIEQMMRQGIQQHHDLVDDVNLMTENEYARQMRKRFTLSAKDRLHEVDWRVPRLMLCKDPKYNMMNMAIPFPLAKEVIEAKLHDGAALEEQLSREAYHKSKVEMEEMKSETVPPPVERVVKKHVPFVHAVPNYERDDDLWQRQLELRSMEEAMRGDVSQPLPRPVLFAEDMDNFRLGKYVKDDCPIA